MAYHLDDHCDQHLDPYECADTIVVKGSSGYGIPIHGSGSSHIEIRHCPWCGKRL